MSLSIDNVQLPQQFLSNLKVLVIDQNITNLHTIGQMCNRYNYKVTTCSSASFALNYLNEMKDSFDVILLDFDQMQGIDFHGFLQHITQQIKIPVIVMSVDGSTSAALKAIANGAYEYWTKPLKEYQIKNMWHHVARKLVLTENLQYDHILGGEKSEKKRDEIDDNASKNTNNGQSLTKKTHRLSWTEELHKQFIEVVNQLGIDKAVPRKIVELMNVPGLTKHHVVSHLQKVRHRLKKSTKKTHSNNEMPKYGKKKSKFDQYHVPVETKSDLESENSMPEQNPNVVLNSTIQHSTSFEEYPVSNIDSHVQQLDSTTLEEYQVSDFIADMLADESKVNLDESWSLSEYGIFCPKLESLC